MARPNLPQADTGERFRNAVADAIARCIARGEDIEFVEGRAIFTSPDGTRFYIRVTDDGIVSTTNIETGVDSDEPGGGTTVTDAVRVRAQRVTSTLALTAASTTTLLYNQQDEDTDSAYDPSTGEFTVPTGKGGWYAIQAGVPVAITSSGAVFFIGVQVNGSFREVKAVPIYDPSGSPAGYGNIVSFLNLSAGDVVKIVATIPTGVVGAVLAAQPFAHLAITSMAGVGVLSSGSTLDGVGAAGQIAKWSDADSLVGITDGVGFLHSNGAGTLGFQQLKSLESVPLADRGFISWYRSTSAVMASLGALISQTPASATTPAKANTSMLTRTLRLRYTGTTGTGQVIGCRTNEAPLWLSAGAILKVVFGQESNIAGGRAFFGFTTSTTPINSDPTDLTNIIGIGYDEGDSDSGNWYLFHNDGSGTATKVDTGVARDSSSLLKLEIYTEDGTSFEVRVANLETGEYVFIDTAIDSNIPDGETDMRINAQIRNEVSGGGTAPLLSIVYMTCEHGPHFP